MEALSDDELAAPDRGLPGAVRQRREPRRPARRGVRHRAGGGLAGARPAPLRRAAHGRHGPALRLDRRDEDRRGQDPRLDAARVPQRPVGTGHARDHGERLPGRAGRGLDGPGPPVPRAHRGPGEPRAPRLQRQARGLRLRRHLRHEHGVRLRLPARQHGALARAHGAEGPRLRHRRRGRLDPHRRGAHPAHHLGPGLGVGQALLPVRRHRPHPAGRHGLRDRRGEAHRGAHRGGHRQGGEPDRRGQHVRPGLGQLRASPHPGAAGQGALPPRQGLPGGGGRGEDRRRVHGPDPRGAPVVRRPAPGGRGQGAGADQGGEPHLGHGDAAELLPALREAGGHDRDGGDRGGRVRLHLRHPGGAHPHQRAHGPHGPARPHLQVRGRQVRVRGRRHRRALRAGPARAGGHRLGGQVRASLPAARAPGHPAPGPQRQAAHP